MVIGSKKRSLIVVRMIIEVMCEGFVLYCGDVVGLCCIGVVIGSGVSVILGEIFVLVDWGRCVVVISVFIE